MLVAQPRLQSRYGLLTLAWLGAIYWLSSRPDLSATESHAVVLILSNLSHAPLFAGLAFCCLKALSPKPEASRGYALVFLLSGTFAALDEWHQAFVPGRAASVSDFFVDLAGIGGLLLIFRIRALRRSDPRPARNSSQAKAS